MDRRQLLASVAALVAALGLASAFAAMPFHRVAPLKRLVPSPASYVSESDYFEAAWRTAYWGVNATRLAAIKQCYDPEGLFFVHHGIGSERWSADGFTRLV